MRKHNIDILGFAEHRMAGQGHFNNEGGSTILYSGKEKSGHSGVGFILSKNVKNCLQGYNPINDRIMTIGVQSKPVDMKFVQVYAPTNAADQGNTEVL